jgi:sulfite reductase beta subunit-like hemoprotein
VPHVLNGEVEGYTITVGGGFGMSHGQLSTRPFLGQPLLYANRANVVDAIEAIDTAQRDHGNRTERKNARLKYTVQTMGLDGFRAEVVRRLPGIAQPCLVALTGWGAEHDRARSAAAGFDHHLTKPVDLGTVQALLAGLAK